MLEYFSASDLTICKVKLMHIGSNYPCMTDPARGYIHTKNNSTMLKYKSSYKEPGKNVILKSFSLKNYGMNHSRLLHRHIIFLLGFGPNTKGFDLDADTIQVAVFLHSWKEGTHELKFETKFASHENSNEVKHLGPSLVGNFKYGDKNSQVTNIHY